MGNILQKESISVPYQRGEFLVLLGMMNKISHGLETKEERLEMISKIWNP